jgi:hypothetical protein
MSNIGILLAIGSAVFNGSFAALFKMPKMVEVDLHPIVFQLYIPGESFSQPTLNDSCHRPWNKNFQTLNHSEKR